MDTLTTVLFLAGLVLLDRNTGEGFTQKAGAVVHRDDAADLPRRRVG